MTFQTSPQNCGLTLAGTALIVAVRLQACYESAFVDRRRRAALCFIVPGLATDCYGVKLNVALVVSSFATVRLTTFQ
jgi:hypothetical protein